MKRIPSLIAHYFSTPIVFPIPSGVVPDKESNLGLFGLMQNVNKYSQSLSSAATSGTNITLTAAQMLAGTAQLNTGASGGFTITTPSASAIVAELGPTVPLDGTFSKVIHFLNNGSGQTGTVTAGVGVTVVGTATVATDTKRAFVLRTLSSAAITLTNVGSLSL